MSEGERLVLVLSFFSFTLYTETEHGTKETSLLIYVKKAEK